MKMIHKKIFPLLAACLAFVALTAMFSCSEEDVFTSEHSEQKGIKIATMGQFFSQTNGITRSCGEIAEFSDMPVLQFKDAATFNATVSKLKSLSKEERASFMKTIGFDGAEQILCKADEELDSIFEIEDETQFETSLKEYQAKYKGIVAFDESDTYDVTPYLTFTDSSMTLVGNIKGYVVIGDKLIAPNNNTPNYGSVNVSVVAKSSMAAGPIQPGFRAFVNSSLTIKNGKYKSTMTLGRIVNGNSFAIKFVTKKKQFLWKKSVNASYSLNLGMSGNKGSHSNNVICPYGKDCTILNTPVETFGNPINVTVANFKSSRGNATGNANFKNVQIQ